MLGWSVRRDYNMSARGLLLLFNSSTHGFNQAVRLEDDDDKQMGEWYRAKQLCKSFCPAQPKISISSDLKHCHHVLTLPRLCYVQKS